MNPGLRDREITLQTATKTQDADTGEEVIDWDELDVTLYAQWLPGNTRESFYAQQRLAAHVDGIFKIEYIEPKPNPSTQRILWDGDIYDMKPAVEIGRREGWEIPVVARVE
jgi:head-tail adaptor